MSIEQKVDGVRFILRLGFVLFIFIWSKRVWIRSEWGCVPEMVLGQGFEALGGDGDWDAHPGGGRGSDFISQKSWFVSDCLVQPKPKTSCDIRQFHLKIKILHKSLFLEKTLIPTKQWFVASLHVNGVDQNALDCCWTLKALNDSLK